MSAFDLIIIGAGPGGYVCAIRAAQLGMKVAIIEKRTRDGKVRLGGTCLNVGCIPSKALLDSSERFADASHRLEEHGITVGGLRLDVSRMMARKERVVGSLVDGVGFLMKKNRITVLTGSGRLVASGEVELTPEGGSPIIHTAPRIVLAMGSVPIELPSVRCDGTTIVTSDQAIAFERVPRRLTIIGGGVIGLELGSVWSRLGSEVTVVEFLPHLCPFLDDDVSKELEKILTKQGLHFRLGTRITDARSTDAVVSVSAQDSQGTSVTWSADTVLVAVGRRPLTDGLARAGIALDERHRVIVDERFATNVPGVFAIGDLIPGPMLAHKAEDEGVALAEQLAGGYGAVDHALIPNVIYTDPEVATVGLTHADATRSGIAVRVGRFPFQANGRAKASGVTDGFVKILVHPTTDRILGASIIGPRASDLLAEITAVMAFGGSSEDIARTCHAHPTYSEAVREAALDCLGRVLHG